MKTNQYFLLHSLALEVDPPIFNGLCRLGQAGSNTAHTVPIVQYFYLWMNMNLVMFGSMWMLSIELGI